MTAYIVAALLELGVPTTVKPVQYLVLLAYDLPVLALISALFFCFLFFF